MSSTVCQALHFGGEKGGLIQGEVEKISPLGELEKCEKNYPYGVSEIAHLQNETGAV